MKYIHSRILGLIIICLIVVSCDDIIEKEIGDQTLELLAPYNGAELSDLSASFWWTEIEYARGYRVQIVSPTFDKIERLVVDSIVTDNKFDCILTEGIYEWRVKAFNEASELDSDESGFKITLNEGVTLLAPYDGAELKTNDNTFWWKAVSDASSYRIQIASPSFSKLEKIVVDQVVKDTKFNCTLENGTYEWRVIATNGGNDLTSDSNEFVVSVEVVTEN